jgi:hypothetical protein
LRPTINHSWSKEDKLELNNEDLRVWAAQTRQSGWVIAGSPWALLGALSLREPSYASPLLTTSVGRLILTGMVIFWLLGVFSIRHIGRPTTYKQAQTAGLRMLFPITGCIFPTILGVLLGPTIALAAAAGGHG